MTLEPFQSQNCSSGYGFLSARLPAEPATSRSCPRDNKPLESFPWQFSEYSLLSCKEKYWDGTEQQLHNELLRLFCCLTLLCSGFIFGPLCLMDTAIYTQDWNEWVAWYGQRNVGHKRLKQDWIERVRSKLIRGQFGCCTADRAVFAVVSECTERYSMTRGAL